MDRITSKQKIRSLRFKIFMLASIVWLVGWYLHLDKQRNFEISRIQPCPETSGVIDTIKDYTVGCGSKSRQLKSVADSIVSDGMTLATLSIIVIFIGSGYVAKSLVERELSVKSNEAKRAEEIATEIERKAAEDRQQVILEANKSTKLNINRVEFIKKLGIAEEYIILLSDPKYREESSLLKQNILTELRDIVAKHPIPDLRALIHSDEAIQFKISALIRQLQEHSVRSMDADLMASLLNK